MNYDPTFQGARSLAHELAAANNVHMPANWERDKKAGVHYNWVLGHGIMRRDSLSLRKPEGCSLARTARFIKKNVVVFFKHLKIIYGKYPSLAKGTRIYNLDEMGVTTQ